MPPRFHTLVLPLCNEILAWSHNSSTKVRWCLHSVWSANHVQIVQKCKQTLSFLQTSGHCFESAISLPYLVGVSNIVIPQERGQIGNKPSSIMSPLSIAVLDTRS